MGELRRRHHITRKDYDLELLKKCIRHVKETYDVEVYLERVRLWRSTPES